MADIKIVPRWEWRCFAPSLAALATAVNVPSDVRIHESDETYILSLEPGATDNVKIRGGVLDLKRLRQTDKAGLQQWEPVLKAPFPLRRADMATVFGDRHLRRDSYGLADLLAFVVEAGDLRAVDVHKSRRGFIFGGCIAELARVTMRGAVLDSFSLEHEDPRLVVAALDDLRLDGHVNTSYPEALRQALGRGWAQSR